MAELLGVKQSGINRYEQGQSALSLETLAKYADYFDVSMDYLFIEMCFDPQSPMSEKLKQTILQIMEVESK